MITRKRISLFLMTFVFALASASHVTAQQPPVQVKPVRPSQKASVMQTIGVTDITITYSRPGVKGRTIFADAPPSMEERAKGEATLDNQNERKPGEPIVPYNHVWRAGANEAKLFQVTDDVLINGQPLKAGSYSLHTIPGKGEWTIIFNSDPVNENSAQVNIRWEKVNVPFTIVVKDVKALWRAKADALIAANPANEARSEEHTS